MDVVRGKPSIYRPGQVVGFWLLISRNPPVRGHRYWDAKCTKCNSHKVFKVEEWCMRKGISKHCRKCNTGRFRKPPKVQKGHKYFHWTVETPLLWFKQGDGRKYRFVRLQCVCGKLHNMQESRFLFRPSKSCGCMRGMDFAERRKHDNEARDASGSCDTPAGVLGLVPLPFGGQAQTREG